MDEMRFNESLGYLAPIKYSVRERGYFYADENYSIDKLPLSNDDANALIYAADLLSHYKNLEILSGVKEAIDKVVESIQIKSHHNETWFMENISFEKAVYQPGGEHLNALIYALKNKQQVQIEYKKFNEFEEKEYELEPKLLKEFRGIWYVLAFVKKYNGLRTFALDRILSIELLKENQTTEMYEEVKTYFDGVIGINGGGEKSLEIILDFNVLQGNYLKIQPIHTSQEIVEEQDDFLRIKLEVYPNTEFYMKLLSYGDSFKVISPNSVKKELLKIVDGMKENLMK
jgi:predicted DNA-binding transcriptional regulator YafY